MIGCWQVTHYPDKIRLLGFTTLHDSQSYFSVPSNSPPATPRVLDSLGETGRARPQRQLLMSETQRHTHRVSPDFTPGKPRKAALHGGGVMHLTLPPIISPRTRQAPARSRKQMPWGGRAPQPWMMSPRESTYKRQCVDTEAFHLNKYQAERESIRMAFGEGSEWMKSPRERTREMLDKRPVEVTDILKKQAFVSDIFQRRPPPDHENADIIQSALVHSPRADPLLQGKPGWRNPGLQRLI